MDKPNEITMDRFNQVLDQITESGLVNARNKHMDTAKRAKEFRRTLVLPRHEDARKQVLEFIQLNVEAARQFNKLLLLHRRSRNT